MGRPSAYERQLKAAQTESPTQGASAAAKKTTPTKRPGGRKVAPPSRPIAADTTNRGPDGEILFEILLTPDQVALWLGKPKATLYSWRTRGQGPTAIRVGSDLRYRRNDVETWLSSQVLDQTA